LPSQNQSTKKTSARQLADVTLADGRLKLSQPRLKLRTTETAFVSLVRFYEGFASPVRNVTCCLQGFVNK